MTQNNERQNALITTLTGISVAAISSIIYLSIPEEIFLKRRFPRMIFIRLEKLDIKPQKKSGKEMEEFTKIKTDAEGNELLPYIVVRNSFK